MSTVSDGLYQYGGVPVNTPLMHTGQAWFVKPHSGSDSNSGKKPSQAFATLAQALSKATANNGEAVYLIAESNTAGNTTDYQSTGLDWNKDGVHLIGVNAGPAIGQRSRIAQLSTVVDIENLFTVSANNCYIANIEVFHGVDGSTATSPVAVKVTGQRNHIVNCQFSGIADSVTTNSMDTAGARSLWLSAASENTFENCYIGLDTVLRATATAEVELTGACTRNIFRNCHFRTYTSTAGMYIVSIAAAMDRFTLFDNCMFTAAANISSATAVTAVFDANAVNGEVLLRNPFISGCTNYTAADAARVKALGHNGLATGHLVGISAAIDVT